MTSMLPLPGRRRLALALAALGVPCAAARQSLVNDATGLNPVTVDRILAPRTVDDIVSALRSLAGPGVDRRQAL